MLTPFGITELDFQHQDVLCKIYRIMIFLKVTIMRVIVMKPKIYIKLCNSFDKIESEETCIFNLSAFRESNNK